MASLVNSGKYGTINTTDTPTIGFYDIMFTSEAYTLQNNTTIYGKIITAGKLVVKAQYLFSMQESTNWFWNQHHQQQVITVPTRTIIYTRLYLNAITDIHDIPKILCNRTREKIHIKTSYLSE